MKNLKLKCALYSDFTPLQTSEIFLYKVNFFFTTIGSMSLYGEYTYTTFFGNSKFKFQKSIHSSIHSLNQWAKFADNIWG